MRKTNALLISSLCSIFWLLILALSIWGTVYGSSFREYKDGNYCALINCTIKLDTLFQNWKIVPENYFFQEEIGKCLNNCSEELRLYCIKLGIQRCCYQENQLSQVALDCEINSLEDNYLMALMIAPMGIFFSFTFLVISLLYLFARINNVYLIDRVLNCCNKC